MTRAELKRTRWQEGNYGKEAACEVRIMKIPYRGSGKVYYADKEYQCDLYYNEKQGGME